MEIDDDRKPGRQDQPDLVEQHVVEAVAARALKLQERPRIDGKPHEVEAGTPQRLQLGDVQPAALLDERPGTRTPLTAAARSRAHAIECAMAMPRRNAGSSLGACAAAGSAASHRATAIPARQRMCVNPMRIYMLATGSPSCEWNAR